MRYGSLLLALVSAAFSIAITGCGRNIAGSSSSTLGATTATRLGSQSSTGSSSRAAANGASRLGKRAYEKALQKLGRKLGASVSRLYPLSTGAKDIALARSTLAKLRAARAVVTDVEAALVKIVPPREIASEHKLLRAAVGQLGTQLDKLVRSLQHGDLELFTHWSSLPALRKIGQIADAISQRGYDISN